MIEIDGGVVCNLCWVFKEGFSEGAASEPKPE